MTAPIRVAILVRVSTDEQDNTRQIEELQEVARHHGWEIVKLLREDGVSGAAPIAKRPALQELLALVTPKRIDKILIHEITRLSRNPVVLHTVVEQCTDQKVSIYWHTQRCETLLPNGDRNPATGLMLAILGEMGRTEREFLAKRIRSGMEAAKRKGRHMGRPHGTTTAPAVTLAKHADIVKLTRQGQSIRHTVAITGKAKATVEKVRRLMKLSD